jgi:hypothetical protein
MFLADLTQGLRINVTTGSTRWAYTSDRAITVRVSMYAGYNRTT